MATDAKWHPVFIIALVESFFDKLVFSGKVAPNLVILG
jgi:hypothetical protein